MKIWSHAAWAGALTLVLSAGIAQAAATPEPSDGRVSAFYEWTHAIPAKPGVLLRSEPLPPAFVLPGAASGERILYSSTDGISGKGIITVSGALFLPKGKAPEGGWPVLSWAHGTVGVADHCAPSWAGRSLRDIRYLSAWLDQGFAVVASDYQGLGTPGIHPYLATRPEGYSVLDAARAAVGGRSELANSVVLIGQSQGGGAVIAAAGFAPEYAPDLRVMGTVATGTGTIGGPSAEMMAPSDKVDATSAYAFYLALSLMSVDPSIEPGDVLSEKALPLLSQAATRCIESLEGDIWMAGLNWSNVLSPMSVAVLARNAPLVAMPTYHIPTPVFMGTGERDIDVDPRRQHELADALCRAGTQVYHHVYGGLDHSATVNASLSDSLPFVRGLLAGKAAPGSCKAAS